MTADYHPLCAELVKEVEGLYEALQDMGYGWITPESEALIARAHTALAESVELPPRPPMVTAIGHPDLVRYSVTWDGSPNKPLLTPRQDGYWTPWHVAAELLERQTEPEPPAELEGRSSDAGYEAGSMWAGHPVTLAADEEKGGIWKIVLSEDDCAPDARESFERDFRRFSGGLSVGSFKSLAQFEESNNGMTISWRLGGVELSISADDPFYCVRKRTRTADLLEHLAEPEPPAIAPIPVSERSPNEEDCDEKGRCWHAFLLCGDPTWTLDDYNCILRLGSTHWLPAHALPLPTGDEA